MLKSFRISCRTEKREAGMTLDQLSAGQSAEIVDIDAGQMLRPRLLEMGLTPGVTLAVVRVAPLGDPIQISVRGTRISLRKQDAASIRCRG
jgi:ferrous iron transport protein A